MLSMFLVFGRIRCPALSPEWAAVERRSDDPDLQQDYLIMESVRLDSNHSAHD